MRSVGAFGDFAIDSSADLDNMIFSMGTTFIFGSWIYEADSHDKLQSHLMQILAPQASPDASTITLDQLAEKFSHLSIFDPTRIQEVTCNHNSHLDTALLSGLEVLSKVQFEDQVCFPLRLSNSASTYQDSINYLLQSEQEIPLRVPRED